jgi:hypothetical protein
LFRAQERSTVAEEAWARAALDDEAHGDSAVSPDFTRLDVMRKRAIDLIRNAQLPSALADRAIAILDHAYYSAITQARQANPSNAWAVACARHTIFVQMFVRVIVQMSIGTSQEAGRTKQAAA